MRKETLFRISRALLASALLASGVGNGDAGSTSTLFVPIVLSSGGAGASFYTSELTLTNRGLTAATVELRYTAAFGGGEGSCIETLLSGEQKIIPDAIAYLRGRGVPIAEGAGRGGTLQATFTGLSSSDAAAATVRTTTATAPPRPLGAAGLSYPGIPPASSFSTSATLYGLRTSVDDRSNVAVYNPATEPVTVRITAFAGDGTGLSVVKADSLEIPGLGWTQLSGILDGTGITNGWVTVEKTGGSGSFGAYGVINDNRTSDGSFVFPVGGTLQGASLTVPVLVETTAGFTSELVLTNRAAVPAGLTMSYVESLAPLLGTGGIVTLDLAPATQLVIPDAIDYLRGKGVKIGARGAASFAGTLRVSVAGTTLSNIFAGARTAALCPAGGQFGLFTPGIYSGQEASAESYVYGLRADALNRTNVALVNAGADGGGAVTLEIQAFDGEAGGVARGDPETIALEPGAWHQYSGFLGSRGVGNGWVRVRRLAGSAPWIAYGVVNDGGAPGERTGDGAYVPMVIAPATPSPPDSEETFLLPGGIPLVMVKIPAGSFLMGAPTTERFWQSNETLHTVTLTRDYYMGKYEVTQAQWQAVMGSNPSIKSACGDGCPVENVSWNDIRGPGGFVEKLNQQLGSTKFRLPTEAEWERAARGGTQSRFSFGDALDGDDQCGATVSAEPYLWWCENSGDTTHPVGTKRANPFGLYDVHGNVWEWVEDWFGAYPTSDQTDPGGPATGTFRAYRGGSLASVLGITRSAFRGYSRPDEFYRSYSKGFRLAWSR